MPRGKIPSWAMKTAIWDLASKLGPKPEAILRDLEKLCHRDMPLEGEAPPDSRTVKSVIQELQNLKLEVLATLPRRIWQLRGDYHTIRAELENLVAGGTLEDLPSVAGKLKIQLRTPAPEMVLIDDFGEPGRHHILLKQDVFRVLCQNLGYDISKFKVYKSSGTATGDIQINVAVSDYGIWELFYPVEEHPLFAKLLSSLSEPAQQKLSTWKQHGGQFLTMCSDIRREIHTEASNSTPQSLYEAVFRIIPGIFKPSGLPPSPLTDNFGNLVYRLCILHRRASDQFGLPGKEQYITRPRRPFHELYLGQIHLATVPNPPFPPPPPPYTAWSQFLEGWADLHRDMIMKWSASPAIRELLELFKSLHRIETAIKQELDDVIRGKQP